MDIKEKVKEAYTNKMVVYDENVKSGLTERFLYLLKIVMREVYGETLNCIYTMYDFQNKDFTMLKTDTDITSEFMTLYTNSPQIFAYKGKMNMALAIGKSGKALLGAF